jgi:putative protease
VAKFVVLSRELSIKQITKIIQQTEVEIKNFAHGAMCMAFSYRCYLSAYALGKSGNFGECIQPCRCEWKIHGKIGLLQRVWKYLLSAKDLRMIVHIPELIKAENKFL